MFELEVFRKQMQCIEESTCDIVGRFRCLSPSFDASRSDLPLDGFASVFFLVHGDDHFSL